MALDIEVTQELKLEGHARELIRQINELRKKQGLTIGDLVDVNYQTESDELKKMIDKYGDEIKKNTLTKELAPGLAEIEVDINGHLIKLKLKNL